MLDTLTIVKSDSNYSKEECKTSIELRVASTPSSSSSPRSTDFSPNINFDHEKFKRSHLFMNAMTKSTIIVVVFCIQPIIIDLFWYLRHWGHLSIMIPMNLMSLNMVIDAFCILLFNKFGEKHYNHICKWSKCDIHSWCQECCRFILIHKLCVCIVWYVSFVLIYL